MTGRTFGIIESLSYQRIDPLRSEGFCRNARQPKTGKIYDDITESLRCQINSARGFCKNARQPCGGGVCHRSKGTIDGTLDLRS